MPKSTKDSAEKKEEHRTSVQDDDDVNEVPMYFTDPNTIKEFSEMRRAVSSPAFAFDILDEVDVRIGDGKFTRGYSQGPQEGENWILSKFESDTKVTIRFMVGEFPIDCKTEERETEWEVWVRHIHGSPERTTIYKSNKTIVFGQQRG